MPVPFIVIPIASLQFVNLLYPQTGKVLIWLTLGGIIGGRAGHASDTLCCLLPVVV